MRFLFLLLFSCFSLFHTIGLLEVEAVEHVIPLRQQACWVCANYWFENCIIGGGDLQHCQQGFTDDVLTQSLHMSAVVYHCPSIRQQLKV